MQRKELFSPSSRVPSFARGINILVVDHDTTSLMYLASMLEQYSYKVTTTELASVALPMIRQEKGRFELVIANVNVSDTYCLSFLRVLLKEEIPVILMSSKRSVSVSWTALVEGACFFLEKPISIDDLKYVWQHAFKRRSKRLLGETQKPEPETVNHRNVSQRRRIIEEGDVSRNIAIDNADDDLQYSISKQMEVDAEGFILDENSVQDSQNNCMEQHLMANDHSQKQGGFKTTRSLDDDKGGEKENGKMRKLNPDNKNSNNIMTPTEEIEEKMDINNNGNVQRKSKPRIIWTPELHLKFTEAVSVLGDLKARPKHILQNMKVPGLTLRQVSSHLQKYKNQVQQISDNATTNLPSTIKGKSSSIYTTNTGSLKTHEMIRPSVACQPTLRYNDFAAAGKTQGVGIVQVENASGSSSNVVNAGNQEVNATAVPLTPAASSVNQNQPLSEYVDLLKLLYDEEDEIKAGLGGEPKLADLDRYCEWLTEALMEDSQHFE